jgi:DNA polymerase-1
MADLRAELLACRHPPRELIAVVATPAGMTGVAWPGGSAVANDPIDDVVASLTDLDPRWVWWNARDTATGLVAHGVRPHACWDLGAVGMLTDGIRRDDPSSVWASGHGLAPPPRRGELLDLFDIDPREDGPLRDGQLSPEWLAGGWHDDPDRVRRWAELALELATIQRTTIAGLDDPRPITDGTPLRSLIAHSESAAALLAVELEHDGLPVDREVAGELLRAHLGDRPADAEAEAARLAASEREVLAHFPGEPTCDLRSPEQVRELLATIGLDLPDTRSWRLEPHKSLPAVAALLAWRKADRLATTYGWRWLDTNVGTDGRLRGQWYAADGGAGRMTAGGGLHNLPAELRGAVRAEPGHLLIRADLGQIEPRVLATVSRDEALAAATHAADMYAPVAARLGCDRSTAKVAVLAAMYGQTSGTAGEALRAMDREYSTAMAFLRQAEDSARNCVDFRTYGGRLIRFGGTREGYEERAAVAARGRYGRNAVIQGAAAELFKAWAATVRHNLRAVGGQIVLCLHDELVVHAPVSQLDDTRRILSDSLAATTAWWAAGSGVRFVAEIAAGESWADAH